MEKDSKRKVTPDINEELMMNLMVDGIKKERLTATARTCRRAGKGSGKRRGKTGRFVAK